jgi:hypothetical protein
MYSGLVIHICMLVWFRFIAHSDLSRRFQRFVLSFLAGSVTRCGVIRALAYLLFLI